MDRPKPLETRDWSPLQNTIEYYMEGLAKGELYEDTKQYIFEAAIEAVYGRDVWKWVNERLDEPSGVDSDK